MTSEAALHDTAPATPAPTDGASRGATSRRRLLRLAGAAATGAAASALIARPAAATDGEAVTLGQWKTATSQRTRADYVGGLTGGQAFLFQAGSASSGDFGAVSSALAGWTSVATMPTGIYGLTSVDGGCGVWGRAGGASSYGVRAQNTAGPGLFSSGTTIGVHGTSSAEAGIAVVAAAANGGTGLSATGHDAVMATGSRYGVVAGGNWAALRLLSLSAEAPPSRGLQGVAGALDVDSDFNLWFCVAGGTPGTWRKIAGPGVAGGFHPIGPYRVYDSRKPSANPLSTGTSRTVSVANAIDGNGATLTENVVPPNATAIAYNLTVAGTAGNGWLSVNPGGNSSAATSTINWQAAGVVLANASLVGLNANRQVTVACGGGAGTSTNFIIDVTGYYR